MSDRDTIRAFIAVQIPTEIRHTLTRLSEQLQTSLPHADSLRWVAPETMHITLKFLGDVAVPYLDQVRQTLDDVAHRHLPFETSLGDVGVFPHIRRPRVLWIAATDEENAFRRLARDIEQAMHALGFAAGQKGAFVPHITLARVRRHTTRAKQSTLGEAIGDLDISVQGRWRVDEIEFVRSTLTPKGPIYTMLSRHTLGK